MPKQVPGRLLVLLVIAILLLGAVGWVLWLIGESRLLAARERFEADTGSLALTDYVRPGLEDKENAAIHLRAGAEALQISDSSAEVMAQVLEQDFESWSPETHEAAAALVEANGPAFEQLERCTGLEDPNFDFAYEKGFSALPPPMLDLYRTGRLTAMDLRLARESFLLSSMMHLGAERLFLGAIRDVVEADLEEPDLLRDLHRRLQERDAADALRRGIAGEAAAVFDSMELRGSSADSTGRGEQLYLWFVEPFQLAALLDSYSEVVESLGSPWIELLEHNRSEERNVGWAEHEFLLTNLLDAVDKLKAVELGRLLAIQALEVGLLGLESG